MDTSCASTQAEWHRFVAASVWSDVPSTPAIFAYSITVVGSAPPTTALYLSADLCGELAHWRRTHPDDLWGDLWLVAGFWVQSDQLKAGLPLDDGCSMSARLSPVVTTDAG
jgi:hypothetical protein